MRVCFFILMTWILLSQAAKGIDWPQRTDDGFRVPQPGTTFQFPRAHGSHPDYKIEWWYVVGHLETEAGRPFGFQATFFRSAAPLRGVAANDSPFGADQLFLAHMALTDIEDEQYLHQERLNRDGWAATAAEDTLDLHNGNWRLHLDEAELIQLSGTVNGRAAMTLSFAPRKPLVRFGEAGLSYKGPEPGAASYYLTFTRLEAAGILMLDGQRYDVTGVAWMDHEISSNQLSAELTGWDWTCIQLEDGREIKAYLLREKDGSPSAYSRLIWIDRDGKTQAFGRDEFHWEKLQRWTSPDTAVSWPTSVRITTTDPESGGPFIVEIKPRLAAQEITGELGGIGYWEGACRALDEQGNPIGQAYLELTGYGESIGGAL